jgi:DNA mismatch repair protein MSH6
MGEKSAAAARTPARTPAAAKKAGQAPSTGKQQSILGFFSRTPAAGNAGGPSPSPSTKQTSNSKKEQNGDSSQCLKETTRSNSMLISRRTTTVTPVASSDAIEPSSSQENRDESNAKVLSVNLPSSTSPAEILEKQKASLHSSPSRKVGFPARPSSSTV